MRLGNGSEAGVVPPSRGLFHLQANCSSPETALKLCQQPNWPWASPRIGRGGKKLGYSHLCPLLRFCTEQSSVTAGAGAGGEEREELAHNVGLSSLFPFSL